MHLTTEPGRPDVRPHLWYSDRSAKGLERPIGQSLIRALRHIIEFDSGLLIRHLDLDTAPEDFRGTGDISEAVTQQ